MNSPTPPGFRRRLRSGERLLGTLLSLPSPATAEILSRIGFDWIFIDGEHGPFDLADLRHCLSAIAGRAAAVVRLPDGRPGEIQRVLDLGADGIIVPRVNSAAEAAAIVSAARYPPDGERGVGLGRAHGYGLDFQGYLDTANDRVAVIVQAEHRDAIADIEAIAAVPGIDAVLLGPYDLSASLGHTGEVDHPEVVAAIAEVRRACAARGVPVGMFGVSAEAVLPYREQGFTLLVAGVDTLYLSQGAAAVLAGLRGEA